jgi:hypothetical protein
MNEKNLKKYANWLSDQVGEATSSDENYKLDDNWMNVMVPFVKKSVQDLMDANHLSKNFQEKVLMKNEAKIATTKKKIIRNSKKSAGKRTSRKPSITSVK